MSESIIALDVTYKGSVQGVGFRYTVSQIAKAWPVLGYVENMDDLSVHLYVMGQSDQVESFLDQINKAMDANISSIEKNNAKTDANLKSFFIRY